MRSISLVSLTLIAMSSLSAASSGYESVINPENRPMLGVQMTPVPINEQEKQGLPPNVGVYVQTTYPNTAAQTMGLQPGDVITSINGSPISSMSDLRNEVSLNQIGDPVEVTFHRGGQEQSSVGQFQPWPANIPYDPIDPVMEERFREWQERRLARMQEEVEQLRQQAQSLAKELSEPAKKGAGILGVNEKPPMGIDGQPLAWKFHYRILPPAALFAAPSIDTIIAPVSPAEVTATRAWHFAWQLSNTRLSQEPL
jgi:membrane-associated protease RseP (regulator of RpoE activity)